MAKSHELAQRLCNRECPVTLIFISSTMSSDGANGGGNELLRRRVAEVASRFPTDVELVNISSDEAPSEVAGLGASDVLLIMKNGELYSQAIGRLPTSEIDRTVRTALAWGNGA